MTSHPSGAYILLVGQPKHTLIHTLASTCGVQPETLRHRHGKKDEHWTYALITFTSHFLFLPFCFGGQLFSSPAYLYHLCVVTVVLGKTRENN